MVTANTDRWFDVALVVIVLSGIFMAGAVAMKLYYNEMYWAKMVGLAVGVVFVYFIRRPLLKNHPHRHIDAWALRGMALASLVTWFSVAACGRWIGFS